MNSLTKKFTKRDDGSLLTPEFRVSFPYVFEPNQNGKKGLAMIFDADIDFTEFDQVLNQAIADKWGNKRPRNLMLPVLDGDDSNREEYRGRFYINGKIGKYGCQVIDAQKRLIEDEHEFYPGCYARAVITLYTWYHPESKKQGISVNVRNVQKTRDGEPLISRVAADDDFDLLSKSETPGVDSL